MESIKYLLLLIVFSASALSSCDSDDEQLDSLEESGIIGTWKLESRTIDGITGLIIECCDYIEFRTEGKKNDLQGQFISSGVGYETIGVFEINNTNNTIQFDYNTKQLIYEYQVSNDLISFFYIEDNQDIIEDWRKE